jgi:hypothetical protein
MSEPFTLRVFIPSGDPEGTRIIEKMNWTGRGCYMDTRNNRDCGRVMIRSVFNEVRVGI